MLPELFCQLQQRQKLPMRLWEAWNQVLPSIYRKKKGVHHSLEIYWARSHSFLVLTKQPLELIWGEGWTALGHCSGVFTAPPHTEWLLPQILQEQAECLWAVNSAQATIIWGNRAKGPMLTPGWNTDRRYLGRTARPPHWLCLIQTYISSAAMKWTEYFVI